MTYGIIYPEFSGKQDLSGLMRNYLGFFDLQKLNPVSISVDRIRKTSDNPENFSFFSDYQGFPGPTNGNKHQIWILQVKIH